MLKIALQYVFDRLVFGPSTRSFSERVARHQELVQHRREWEANRPRVAAWFEQWGGAEIALEDEFDTRLDMDGELMLWMTREERGRYLRELVRLRDLAHNRDLAADAAR